MNLSTKGRYAARAALELAKSYDQGDLKLGEIAKRQEISERYLERLMNSLITAGLVRSTRGKKGGFRLTRHPDQIKLSQIIRAAEGSLSLVNCVDYPHECHRYQECVTRDVWKKISKSMINILNKITLKDMIRMQKEKTESSRSDMYHI
jgi:Rrf2 family protein